MSIEQPPTNPFLQLWSLCEDGRLVVDEDGDAPIVITKHNDADRGGPDEDYLVIYEKDGSIISLSSRGVEPIGHGYPPVLELATVDLEPPADLTQIEREQLAREKVEELHKVLDQQERGE